MERIYLDWNATGPMLPEVREAMIEALGVPCGNASSVHREGQRARGLVERARRRVARAVGAGAQGVVFCGGATEANNHVLRQHARYRAGARLAALRVEHPSVVEVAEELARRGVAEVDWLEVDRAGRLALDEVRRACEAGATLVSVMWANNETGNVYPVEEVARIAHERGALVHVDATQALGRVPVDLGRLGADFVTLSAHKTGGPQGVGVLIVAEGVELSAQSAGGHQERGRRPGTENVAAIEGLARAVELAAERGASWRAQMSEVGGRFLAELERRGARFEVRGDPQARLVNTLNLAFDGIDGEDLLLGLDLEGVAASSGSACTAGSLEPSHVILAMGYDEEQARRSVRFSWGPTTSVEEAGRAARIAADAARRLGAIEGRTR